MNRLNSSTGDSLFKADQRPAYDDYRTVPDSYLAEFLPRESGAQGKGLGPVKIHLNGSTLKNGDQLREAVTLEGTLNAFARTDSYVMYFVTSEGARSAMVTVLNSASPPLST